VPKFTIVIPTRQRGVNLRESIPTVLNQTDRDFELIIQDNCSTDGTEAVVSSFSDDRIRYHRSDVPLPMHENWEQALDLIRGDYVIYLGDDDGLMPDCLEKCRAILSTSHTHLIKYGCHGYGWPNHNSEMMRNYLGVVVSRGSLRRVSSRDVLKGIYAWTDSIGNGPNIYNGLVSRELIAHIRAAAGGYFVDLMPDFCSILMNLGFSESFVRCDAPLGVFGWSGLSNGGTYLNPEAARRATRQFMAETNLSERAAAATDIAGRSMTAQLIAIQQRIKNRVYSTDSELEINHDNALARLIENIHDGSLPYEEYVNDVREYAGRLGKPADSLSIPARITMTRPAGTVFNSINAAESLRLDASTLGITSLTQAVAAAFALTGPADLGSAEAGTEDQSPLGIVRKLRGQLAAQDNELASLRGALQRVSDDGIDRAQWSDLLPRMMRHRHVRHEDGVFVIPRGAAKGIAVYGPYLPIPPGTWRLSYQLSVPPAVRDDERLIGVDVMCTDHGSQSVVCPTVHFRKRELKPVVSDDGSNCTRTAMCADVFFVVEPELSAGAWEFRLWNSGASELIIHRISLDCVRAA
jgi:hypothetical protein